MEYNCKIKDLKAGMTVEGFYLLKQAAVKTTNAGKPFLSAVLEDRSGTIEIKSWDYQGTLGAGDAGHVVKIRGEVSEYKNALQITVGRIRRANPGDV